MSVLSFEYYRLEYQRITDGYRDSDGNYHQGTMSWVCVGKCDAVPAGVHNIIRLPDGMMETYSFTIYNLPKDCKEFKYGDKIRLTITGGEQRILTVKGFARYQHQSKIWA